MQIQMHLAPNSNCDLPVALQLASPNPDVIRANTGNSTDSTIARPKMTLQADNAHRLLRCHTKPLDSIAIPFVWWRAIRSTRLVAIQLDQGSSGTRSVSRANDVLRPRCERGPSPATPLLADQSTTPAAHSLQPAAAPLSAITSGSTSTPTPGTSPGRRPNVLTAHGVVNAHAGVATCQRTRNVHGVSAGSPCVQPEQACRLGLGIAKPSLAARHQGEHRTVSWQRSTS